MTAVLKKRLSFKHPITETLAWHYDKNQLRMFMCCNGRNVLMPISTISVSFLGILSCTGEEYNCSTKMYECKNNNWGRYDGKFLVKNISE